MDQAAAPLRLTRSEVVRQALRQWLRQRAVAAFEQEWIAALERDAEDPDRAEVWPPAQTWSRR